MATEIKLNGMSVKVGGKVGGKVVVSNGDLTIVNGRATTNEPQDKVCQCPTCNCDVIGDWEDVVIKSGIAVCDKCGEEIEYVDGLFKVVGR